MSNLCIQESQKGVRGTELLNCLNTANGTKDNVKYLEALQPELAAFYSGAPQDLSGAISNFFNALKKMHMQPGRSYNEQGNMASLFSKTSARILQTCKTHLQAEADNLWDHDRDELIAVLCDIDDMHRHFRESFRLMRERLHSLNKAYLDFNEDEAFAELDMFCFRTNQVSLDSSENERITDLGQISLCPRTPVIMVQRLSS